MTSGISRVVPGISSSLDSRDAKRSGPPEKYLYPARLGLVQKPLLMQRARSNTRFRCRQKSRMANFISFVGLYRTLEINLTTFFATGEFSYGKRGVSYKPELRRAGMRLSHKQGEESTIEGSVE
jgi:hypothetical protein